VCRRLDGTVAILALEIGAWRLPSCRPRCPLGPRRLAQRVHTSEPIRMPLFVEASFIQLGLGSHREVP
jgi:hypothetical protein